MAVLFDWHADTIELTIHEAVEEHEKWWAADTDFTYEQLRPLV